MYSIIYRSVAKPDFGKAEIYRMLSQSRSNNEEMGITGCLLYHKNQFLQLLEGEKDEVTSLYHKILSDSRHTDILTLKEATIDQPIFLDWSMAFHDFENTNGSGAYQKLRKMDAIFQKSNVFEKPSEMALGYFKTVNDILFAKN